MKFTLLISALAAAASSFPSENIEERGLGSVCPPLDTPLCCETVVEGLVGLTCSSPSPAPGKSVKKFVASCKATGLTANCCTADVDGTGVACTAVA